MLIFKNYVGEIEAGWRKCSGSECVCTWNEKQKKEVKSERFWTRFNECIGGFESNVRVIALGDVNAKVGDREREGIVGKFGVPGTNENGVCLLELCNVRGLIVGKSWFEKKLIYKYI